MSIQEQDSIIKNIVDLVLDLEALYIENFKKGGDEIANKIISTCKGRLNNQIIKLNLFNVSLQQKPLKYKKTNHDPDFLNIQEIPRIYLSFQPKEASNLNENVDKDNKSASDLIFKINSLIDQNTPREINVIFGKYLSNNDGLMFKLNFPNDLKLDYFKEKMNNFSKNALHMGLEEFMIMQQFDHFFDVQYRNPFDFEIPIEDQSIYILVHNVSCQAPSYFFHKLINHLRDSIVNFANASKDKKNQRFSKELSYNSINHSLVAYKLKFNLAD